MSETKRVRVFILNQVMLLLSEGFGVQRANQALLDFLEVRSRLALVLTHF